MFSRKAKQNEETEDFINKWQLEEILWNVGSPTYKDRSMHHESIKRLMAKFTMAGK